MLKQGYAQIEVRKQEINTTVEHLKSDIADETLKIIR